MCNHCSSPYEPIQLHAVKCYLFMPLCVSKWYVSYDTVSCHAINTLLRNKFCFWKPSADHYRDPSPQSRL
jgi:hypothetical protein